MTKDSAIFLGVLSGNKAYIKKLVADLPVHERQSAEDDINSVLNKR